MYIMENFMKNAWEAKRTSDLTPRWASVCVFKSEEIGRRSFVTLSHKFPLVGRVIEAFTCVKEQERHYYVRISLYVAEKEAGEGRKEEGKEDKSSGPENTLRFYNAFSTFYHTFNTQDLLRMERSENLKEHSKQNNQSMNE